MSTRYPFSLAVVFGLVAWMFVSGCSQGEQEQASSGDGESVTKTGDGYNPHDVPITEEQKKELRQQVAEFPAAVKVLAGLRSELEQETAAGIPENPFEAHQSLDKADLVLQWLPEIARDSGVAKEHWEAINTGANDLRTLFEQVHQNIDDQQDPDFKAVAGDIDQKLADLAEIVSAAAGNGEGVE